MSFKHKIKRGIKLGAICIATYYVARTCDKAVFGQENTFSNKEIEKRYETKITEIGDRYQTTRDFSERDTIRKMDYQTLR